MSKHISAKNSLPLLGLYAIAMPSGGNKGARTTMAAAERQSAVGIGGEFGGSGTISSESLHICELEYDAYSIT